MFFKPTYLKDAQERRRLLKKIYFYRRGHLTPGPLQVIQDLVERLDRAMKGKNKATIEKLMEESDKVLKNHGGHYYRHYHFFENVETFVVAAILAIGIRSFFLQPFKIPTNSMWPTYHGMTYTLRPADSQTVAAAPKKENKFVESLRGTLAFLLQGTTRHRLVAANDGELSIAVFNAEDREMYRSAFRYQTSTDRVLGIFPSQAREYIFYIGDSPTTLKVPAEFSMDNLLMEKYFPEGRSLTVDAAGRLSTGVQVHAGETVLDFEIETGDMLFVDRFSYNFISPKIGDPIVFRTRGVPGLTRLNGGEPDDKYYIKRLVGMPGDELSILHTTLQRNAKPIEGSPIFDLNSKKTPPYRGYEARYDLADGQSVRVGEGEFYAFGDNSPESLDSRVWGGVPKSQLIGRAIFIYYPFTARWGFSR